MEHATINVMTLVGLADNTVAADLKSAGIRNLVENDDELADVINEMEQNARRKKLTDAATTIVNLSNMTDQILRSSVLNLRDVRRQESLIKAKITAINKARAYAAATRNYVPLLKALDLPLPRGLDSSVVTDVPADWVDPSVAKEETTAVKKPATRRAAK